MFFNVLFLFFFQKTLNLKIRANYLGEVNHKLI